MAVNTKKHLVSKMTQISLLCYPHTPLHPLQNHQSLVSTQKSGSVQFDTFRNCNWGRDDCGRSDWQISALQAPPLVTKQCAKNNNYTEQFCWYQKLLTTETQTTVEQTELNWTFLSSENSLFDQLWKKRKKENPFEFVILPHQYCKY